MSALIKKVISQDFVWQAISSRIGGQGRWARGFFNINCPMPGCGDRRHRCGIRHDPEIVVTCYNCGFKSGWSIGDSFGKKFRSFLVAIGLPDDEITELNYRAFQARDLIRASPDAALYAPRFAVPEFVTGFLPDAAQSFSKLREDRCQEPDFLDTLAYVEGRGKAVAEGYEYFWSPSTEYQMNRRVIIPLLFEGRTVGFSARAIDKTIKQRYHMEAPPNYLFNSTALSHPEREIVILAEGILDAVALDCVGLLGSRLNVEQIAWIKSANKRVIMLPDRDKRGQDMIDMALAHDWEVAFPCGGADEWWDRSIKDAAEATRIYGQLYVLTSVLETATSNKIKINYLRKRIPA